jgi:hypothetical protein
MSLCKLIYCSERTPPDIALNDQVFDVKQLLAVSRTNNQSLHVSGILYFNDRYFLQCLEGSRSAVNIIYNKIIADPRHIKITLIEYEKISKRSFSNWDMAYINDSSLSQSLFKMFSAEPTFNPYIIPAESVLLLLQAFKSSIPVIGN